MTLQVKILTGYKSFTEEANMPPTSQIGLMFPEKIFK